VHDVSNSASIFLNMYMVRCKEHWHRSRIKGEETCVPKHL